jgi:E1A/CREB-binding protein
MYNRYEKHGCPVGFPVHTKCIGLFQSINGIDVLLFAMYTYEYNDSCPAPNRRRVYISYLDSVKYFEPSRYRTLAYKCVILEYLRYVKMRGFHTVHLWSCPPAPGDEYVFHCHPPQQKVPQEDQLRRWYYDVLDKSKAEGIVVETTDMYDEFFKDGGKNAPLGSAPDPMSLPYFEGDYVPGEIEMIVGNLKTESRVSGKKASPEDVTSHFQRKQSAGRRSGTRSNRLGTAIYNMKENLIIARLRNRQFVAAVERGDDVSEWPDDDAYPHETDARKTEIQDSRAGGENHQMQKRKTVVNGSSKARNSAAANELSVIGSTIDEDEQYESELFENRLLFLNYCQTNHCQFDDLRRAKHSTMMVLYQLHNPTEPKFVRRCGGCASDIMSGKRFHCNVCPNFDLCEACYEALEVSSSTEQGKTQGRGLMHDNEHTFVRIDIEASVTGAKSRHNSNNEDRAKALNAYLEVLTHAACCEGPPVCRLNNCVKMKQLFVHVKTCEVTHSNGCRICARLLSLILVHARSCSVPGKQCPLPYCDKIRDRNERVRRQQLFMDDRRRQAQNAFYHSSEA